MAQSRLGAGRRSPRRPLRIHAGSGAHQGEAKVKFVPFAESREGCVLVALSREQQFMLVLMKMSILRIVLREIAFRRPGFVIGVFAVAVAVGCVLGQLLIL